MIFYFPFSRLSDFTERVRSYALENLYQHDQKYHSNQHNQIFITVIAVVDGNLTQDRLRR